MRYPMYELLQSFKAIYEGSFRPTSPLSESEEQLLLIALDEAYAAGYLELYPTYEIVPESCPPKISMRITKKGINYLSELKINNDTK